MDLVASCGVYRSRTRAREAREARTAPAASAGEHDAATSVKSTAISFAQAQAQHLSVTFPSGCDQQTGKARIPLYGAAPCYANAASNGGATASGVTGSKIKIVVYL